MWDKDTSTTMQQPAVFNEFHPTLICQPNACKVILKDVKNGTNSATAKFLKCNLSLNGSNMQCKDTQVAHNCCQVKEKLNKQFLKKKLNSNNKTNQFISPNINIKADVSINTQNLPETYSKHHIENGSSESESSNIICGCSNGEKNGLKNGVHNGFMYGKSISKAISPVKFQNGNHTKDSLQPTSCAYVSGIHIESNGTGSKSSLTPNRNGHIAEHSENSIFNHRKHVKLKETAKYISGEDSDISEKDYVLESSQRLSFMNGWDVNKSNVNNRITKSLVDFVDTFVDIKLIRKQSVVACQSKKMRSSPCSLEKIDTGSKSTSNCERTDSGLFKCEWHDCIDKFKTVENLTKHVESEHIHPAKDNDVFVCLWRDCKFSNQPSCSFKWLSKHVIRHCDLKPFKCVIFGCDMTFVTQNGLARHVPTHFNESRVRRACVLTSEAAQKESTVPKPRRSLSASLTSCANGNENSIDEENVLKNKSKLQRFVHQNTSQNSSGKTFNEIKRKVQQATCNPATNSGYNGKTFRIEHKVIGRRCSPCGSSHMLLAPSLDNLFPHKSFWFDANEFRKRKLTYVDVKVKDLSVDVKNMIYDIEHVTNHRRRKKRK